MLFWLLERVFTLAAMLITTRVHRGPRARWKERIELRSLVCVMARPEEAEPATAEPEADERKLMGFKWMTALSVAFCFTWWYKRMKWTVVKHRRLVID